MILSSNIYDWFVGTNRTSKEPARLPEGMRIYAIGDIHGRADLTESVQLRIAQDKKDAAGECLEIYLGDYIDRGPESKETIDLLLSHNPGKTQRRFLKGNHEATLLEFLENPEALDAWKNFGGIETLRSYGVKASSAMRDLGSYQRMQEEFKTQLSQKHLKFYQRLNLSLSFGDYFFVHAGIRPKRSLEAQEEEDLMWIRGEFLNSRADHGKVIVHGHTPVDAPEIWPNRINIDTGAYLTNKLTVLVLEGEQRRFL